MPFSLASFPEGRGPRTMRSSSRSGTTSTASAWNFPSSSRTRCPGARAAKSAGSVQPTLPGSTSASGRVSHLGAPGLERAGEDQPVPLHQGDGQLGLGQRRPGRLRGPRRTSGTGCRGARRPSAPPRRAATRPAARPDGASGAVPAHRGTGARPPAGAFAPSRAGTGASVRRRAARLRLARSTPSSARAASRAGRGGASSSRPPDPSWSGPVRIFGPPRSIRMRHGRPVARSAARRWPAIRIQASGPSWAQLMRRMLIPLLDQRPDGVRVVGERRVRGDHDPNRAARRRRSEERLGIPGERAARLAEVRPPEAARPPAEDRRAPGARGEPHGASPPRDPRRAPATTVRARRAPAGGGAGRGSAAPDSGGGSRRRPGAFGPAAPARRWTALRAPPPSRTASSCERRGSHRGWAHAPHLTGSGDGGVKRGSTRAFTHWTPNR